MVSPVRFWPSAPFPRLQAGLGHSRAPLQPRPPAAETSHSGHRTMDGCERRRPLRPGSAPGTRSDRIMMKSNDLRLAIVLCGIVLTAACQSASPTAPTEPEPEPEPITLTGAWSGSAAGAFITSDAVTATLTQTDAAVTGDWSMPMPPALVVFGAPAEVDLSGPVTGTATGTTAELSFGFRDDVEVFRQYFAPGCALAVTVTSFTATTLEGTWSAQRPRARGRCRHGNPAATSRSPGSSGELARPGAASTADRRVSSCVPRGQRQRPPWRSHASSGDPPGLPSVPTADRRVPRRVASRGDTPGETPLRTATRREDPAGSGTGRSRSSSPCRPRGGRSSRC